jgi:hypothetical protein
MTSRPAKYRLVIAALKHGTFFLIKEVSTGNIIKTCGSREEAIKYARHVKLDLATE